MLFTFPSRYWFTIDHWEYLALGDVLPDSDGISRVPPYSGYIQERTKFRLRGCYPLRRTFRSLRLPRSFVTPYRMSYNPKRQASWFGLCSVSSPLPGNRICFLFLQVLRCFSSWVCLPYPMYSDKDTIPLRMVGFPIRKSSDQSLLTAPRSISALVRPSSTPSVKASTVRPF